MHKILAKYWQNYIFMANFLPIFLINLINILAKTIKYKESFNRNFSQTVCPIWPKFEN